jgi:hypothetical protein
MRASDWEHSDVCRRFLDCGVMIPSNCVLQIVSEVLSLVVSSGGVALAV